MGGLPFLLLREEIFMNRRLLPAALVAAVTSLVFTVIPCAATAATFEPTGRCDSLPVVTFEERGKVELQMRLNTRGEALITDGVVGSKTKAALNRWATETGFPIPADWTWTHLKAALLKLRETTAGGYSVVVDKATQRVLVRRGTQPITNLTTSTGHGQWYRGTRRDGTEYVARALTPSGAYRTGRRTWGWYESPLGCLYNPVFLDRRRADGTYAITGIAFHGSTVVTGSPASAGCVRLRLASAGALYKLLQTGAKVSITGEDPPATNTREDV